MTCERLTTEWNKRNGERVRERQHACMRTDLDVYVCDADDEKINCGCEMEKGKSISALLRPLTHNYDL
jgi:hypothetical protein